ncbi:MAG: site-specific DNA-methyltransferase, partial [Epulopiscium sp.]|nr:site-specific DNA-methyltransferase [Candidatus Epulonipiscium sp.]
MNPKISSELVSTVTNDILEAINDINPSVSTNLKRAFYFKGRKSDKIATKVIEILTDSDDIVLDPFFGGGSFIISALQIPRFIYGIELDN